MIDMDVLLHVTDIVASVLILAGLWGSAKNQKMWWIYCIGSAFFLYVVIAKGLIGLTVMGIATLITGIRNARYKRSSDE